MEALFSSGINDCSGAKEIGLFSKGGQHKEENKGSNQ